MSFAIAATALSAISLVSGLVGARQQARAQKKALKQTEDAEEQRQLEFNRLNQRKPNIGALLAANQQASRMGTYGTLLTGIGGAPTPSTLLGQSTPLGG